MSNTFYYFGFLYIFDLLRCMWISFKPKKEEDAEAEEEVKKITNAIQQGDVMELKNKAEQQISDRISESKSSKSIMQQIFGFLFFIWAVIGYKADTPEKNWFLFDVIVIIINPIILLFIAAFISLSAVYGNGSIKKPSRITLPLEKIMIFTELIIVSYILYNRI